MSDSGWLAPANRHISGTSCGEDLAYRSTALALFGVFSDSQSPRLWVTTLEITPPRLGRRRCQYWLPQTSPLLVSACPMSVGSASTGRRTQPRPKNRR
jgi:hypothetical protein